MQKCSICSIRKDKVEFNFRSIKLGKRNTACKECTRRQVRRHYKCNRNYYLSKAKKRNQERRHILRKFIWDYLSQRSCVDCGEDDPIVLEFDHQGDKKINISHAAQYNYDIVLLQKGMKKCVIRCANCHRRKTAKELDWYKTLRL